MRVTLRIEDGDLDITVTDETESFSVDPVLVESWTNGTPAELFQSALTRAWAAYKTREATS